MAWGRSNAMRKPVQRLVDTQFTVPTVVPATIDWDRLVTLDFETFWSDEYTLSKLSTSEYVRDPRFKAQMVGLKVGSKPTKWYPAPKVRAALAAIPWATHSLLAHHAQFDGFILYERYGISPKTIYDTLSMARALYSNDIGAGLDEVSRFTGGPGKIEGALNPTKNVLAWPKAMYASVGEYCMRDVDECLRVFKHMLPHFPAEEIELIDRICRCFTEPVLEVDRPRVQKELEREIKEKREALLAFVPDADRAGIKLSSAELKAIAPEELRPEEQVAKKLADILPKEVVDIRRVKKLIGSEKFADLLRASGVEPPVKVSPAYMKADRDKRAEMEVTGKKWTFAFAKTDMEFVELQEHENPRIRALVEARLSVKSTTNETRAGRFLKASENGAKLPVYYKYSAAHTHRLGGGNKMNMQNLKRGSELRRSIKAPKGHVLVVADSGQIEARVNAWLWGQEDLLDDFRISDKWVAEHAHIPKKERPVARGIYRDPYCKFGDDIYGREITTEDDLERFVSKVGILGLGYQMGAPRLQKTLALGTMGPAVFLSEDECHRIVQTYRRKNHRIKAGWEVCQNIIRQMADGITGSYKCIAWDKETIYLPNGMTMHYPNLHDKVKVREVTRKLVDGVVPADDEDGEFLFGEHFVYERKDVQVKIYGGLLCENLVQALARIIVMGQINYVARKNRMAMTTHDEGVFLAKIAQGQKVFDFALKEFQTAPAWCSDIPLNADGGFDVIYSK